MSRLNEIEARANAATEGPWRYVSIFEVGGFVENSRGRELFDWAQDDAGTICAPDGDAEFIAHARADVPALVAALRAVLALHTPVDRERVTTCCTCEQWIESTDPEACIEWPCPTVETIHQHLGDDL